MNTYCIRWDAQEREALMSVVYNDTSICQVVQKIIECIVSCYSQGGKVITAGNGGSAAQSQHFVAELIGRMKHNRQSIPAISLCADISTLTCIGNDFGFERCYSRQLEAIASEKDLFIAFTTSGKSRNILEALNVCKAKNITSFVITGIPDEIIRRLCENILEVPSKNTPFIQEAQLVISHVICESVEQMVREKGNSIKWNTLVELANNGYQYLILDRDGVVNEVKANEYIKQYEEFIFTDVFVQYIPRLSKVYKRIFITTNQRCVGLGMLTEEELGKIHKSMLSEISSIGGRIDKVYSSIGVDNRDSCRKPNIGMIKQIQEDFPEVKLEKTVVVGDSYSDRLFAENANIKYIQL